MLPVTSGVGAALTSSVLEPGCAPRVACLHGAGQVAQAQQAAFQIVDVHGIAGPQHGQSPAQHRVAHARPVVELDLVVHAFLYGDVDHAVADFLRRKIARASR